MLADDADDGAGERAEFAIGDGGGELGEIGDDSADFIKWRRGRGRFGSIGSIISRRRYMLPPSVPLLLCEQCEKLRRVESDTVERPEERIERRPAVTWFVEQLPHAIAPQARAASDLGLGEVMSMHIAHEKRPNSGPR